VSERWLAVGGTGRLGRAVQAAEPGRIVPVGRRGLDLLGRKVEIARSVDRLRSDCTGVLCLAAETSVPGCERDPERAREVNHLGVGRLAEVCSRSGLLLVHVSTDYAFGGREAPYAPTDPPCPVNVYGATKAAGEEEVLRRGGSVARISFVVDPPGYAWVAAGARVTKEWVDETAARLLRFLDWTDASRLAGSRRHAPGRPFHVVTASERTLSEVVLERYPQIPVVERAEASRLLPYPFPWDVRLSGAWRES